MKDLIKLLSTEPSSNTLTVTEALPELPVKLTLSPEELKKLKECADVRKPEIISYGNFHRSTRSLMSLIEANEMDSKRIRI